MRSLPVLCPLMLASALSFGGAIQANGVCQVGTCATPGTLAIGSSTTITATFDFTFPNTDQYSITEIFPIMNTTGAPGFASLTGPDLITVTFLGNVLGGTSASDTLRIDVLEDLVSATEAVSGSGLSFPLFGTFSGTLGSGTSVQGFFSDGPFTSNSVSLTPSLPSGAAPAETFSGTISNPALYDAVGTFTFGAGSVSGASITVTDVAPEPASASLLGIGIAGLCLIRRAVRR